MAPSLTTAKSALPDFSLTCQPLGAPLASTPEEKSAITTKSPAHATTEKRRAETMRHLDIRGNDIPHPSRKKPHLFLAQAGGSFRTQTPEVRKQTKNLHAFIFLSSVLCCLSSGFSWSGRRGSNPRHQAWEACTLPAEL